MALLDTRCWECAIIDQDNGDLKKIWEMEYQGGGKFRCPNCMEISLDLSEHTYNVTIAIDVRGNASVISNDKRMTEKDIDDFASDMDDVSRFKSEDAGVYKCEVYWCYSGPFGEEGEWDMSLEFLSMEEIDLGDGK